MGCITEGYVRLNFCQMRLYGHHAAWMMYYGEVPDRHIDHVNGLRSDNRISNLRLADRTQNACNKRLLDTNTSGVVGVGFDKRRKSWTARIEFRKKRISLGSYASFEDAVNARTQAELYYFGQFSKLEPSLKEDRWSPEKAIRQVKSNNISGVTGVSWDRRSQKWAAEIKVKKVKKFLGYFDTVEEAAAARKSAEDRDPEYKPFIRQSLPLNFSN